MLGAAALERVLLALPTRPVHGPWFRIVDYAALQGPPPGAEAGSPAQPLWPGGPKRHGARFTPRGRFDTIYLASDPVTAFLESNRGFLLPDGPMFPLRAGPTVVLTIDGVIADTLDLTEPSIQQQLGTTLAELTGDWRYTQRVGGIPPTQLLAGIAHETATIHALLYRSAKNPDQGTNLAVFTERFGSGGPCYLEVHDPSGRLYQRFG
jgi:RES domain-containing protein